MEIRKEPLSAKTAVSSPASSPTFNYAIYMAGDYAKAKQVCRVYCWNVGMCINIMPADYIYTGGEEAGFKIEFINYPRFPITEVALLMHAQTLAALLAEQLCQKSWSIVGPNETHWYSRD